MDKNGLQIKIVKCDVDLVGQKMTVKNNRPYFVIGYRVSGVDSKDLLHHLCYSANSNHDSLDILNENELNMLQYIYSRTIDASGAFNIGNTAIQEVRDLSSITVVNKAFRTVDFVDEIFFFGTDAIVTVNCCHAVIVEKI
jgi:hypothetical protein